MSVLYAGITLHAQSHVILPFFFVHETTLFQTGIMLALFWELIEWVTYMLLGNYGPLFNYEAEYESPYNVWALDVGGAAIGTLLIMSCAYAASSSDRMSSFWQPFTPTPSGKWWVRLLRFFGIALLVSFLAGFGWKCGFIEAWCTEDGRHTLPWGAFAIIAVLAVYTYASNAPKLTYAVIAALYAPAFLPTNSDHAYWSASFINLITVWPAAILAFAACLVHRYSTYRSPRYSSLSSPSA